MELQEQRSRYLLCERKSIFLMLMIVSGMMGAYTFTLRGGAFCNAQTANVVMMSIAFGQGRWQDGLYFLIPITAYFMGAFLSEILPSPVKRLGLLRWDTCLIGIEAVTLFCIGLMPLSWPHQIVQVLINFIASMQYNTFRQAEGIPMATTFCTNHVRQMGIAAAKTLRKHDKAAMHRGLVHLTMLSGFFGGGVVLSLLGSWMQAKAIWLALIPLLIIFGNLIHADLTLERDDFAARKPLGH